MLQILEEAEDNKDLDDLVFESELNAFELLKMCMNKSDEDSFPKTWLQMGCHCWDGCWDKLLIPVKCPIKHAQYIVSDSQVQFLAFTRRSRFH